MLEVLAREQRALEHLLFRLQHTRGVLAADDERFLALAADELESAAETVRELEAARVVLCDETLRHLVDAAPEPYHALLAEHRAQLGRLAGEVGALLEATEVLAADRLAELDGKPGQFRRLRRKRVDADELDRAIVAAGYQSVLNASTSLRLPALVSFLS